MFDENLHIPMYFLQKEAFNVSPIAINGALVELSTIEKQDNAY